MFQKLLSLGRKINQPNDTIFLKVFNHWCFHVIYWKFPTQISLWKMIGSVNISCCQKRIPQEQKPDLSTKNRNTGEQIITKKSSCLGENGFDLSWLFWYQHNHTAFLLMRSWCLPDHLQHGHICWYMAFQRYIKWYVNCFETHWEHGIITARELADTLLGFSICLWKKICQNLGQLNILCLNNPRLWTGISISASEEDCEINLLVSVKWDALK